MGTSLQIASQIYEGDPTRPGAGYVTFNGKSYRVEGTTHAGQPDATISASDQYILDAGGGQTILGPNINVADIQAWLNSPHAPDNPTATMPASGSGAESDPINQITRAPDSGSSSGSSGTSGSSGSGGRFISAPTGGALDTNPSGQLPLTGSIPTMGGDTLAISGGGVSISSQLPTSGGTTGGTGVTTGNTTPGTSGTNGTPQSTDQSLLSLLAAMYAGAGGGGNADTGLGGLLAGPVNTATGADAGGSSSAQTTGMSSRAKFLILLVIGGFAFWWWKKHHKKGGAK